MKVLLINGSQHKSGCTYTAMNEIAETLREDSIQADQYWIGNKPVGGCIGCFACAKKKRCVFDDKVNEFTALAAEYDGFIFGSPVYFSGMNGNLISFMDRVFFPLPRRSRTLSVSSLPQPWFRRTGRGQPRCWIR